MRRNEIIGKLEDLVSKADDLGLRTDDVSSAREALEFNEWEVAFDIIATQLYEYDVAVDRDFLALSYEIRETMGIDSEKYSFLERLLK